MALKVNEFTKDYAERTGSVDISGNITVTIEASKSDIKSIDYELYKLSNGNDRGYKEGNEVDCTIYGVHYIVKPFEVEKID